MGVKDFDGIPKEIQKAHNKARKKYPKFHYDKEFDVLYIGFGKQPTRDVLAVEEEEGLVLRYKEKTGEIVGLTIIGLKHHVEKATMK